MRGARRRARVAVDAGRPRRFSGRVDHPHLVADDEADLDDRQRREHDQRQHERELDGGLAAFAHRRAAWSPRAAAGGPARRGHPGSTLPMTVSNSFEIAWLPVAHEMSNVAMATAPRITSAYSAVVWPAALGPLHPGRDAGDETTEHVTS